MHEIYLVTVALYLVHRFGPPPEGIDCKFDSSGQTVILRKRLIIDACGLFN